MASSLLIGAMVTLTVTPAAAAVGPSITAVYRDERTLGVITYVADMEIADVTDDGRMDLIATGTSAEGIRLVVWKQTPNGSLPATPLQLPIAQDGPLEFLRRRSER